jgi:hypothetical protein
MLCHYYRVLLHQQVLIYLYVYRLELPFCISSCNSPSIHLSSRLLMTMSSNKTHVNYDYDYFVIGGGSGGVRSSRIAAQYGARVALAEEKALGILPDLID